MALLAVQLAFVSRGYESQFPHYQVLRDSTATTVAYTRPDGDKQLLVNGVGITGLTPITKMMAHLPMAFLNRPPRSALNVCFGMGTTFRSLLSWGVPTTSVELVPSVPHFFSYYHADGDQLLRSPLARVVIDDGRRYLERSSERFDVITIDPPPPIEAAGVSMLYSKEFYRIINQRLQPDGILQQWLWEGDPVVQSAVARALSESFPYVRVFQYYPSYGLGYQFLASRQPIPNLSGSELARRMPESAVRDLLEMAFRRTPEEEMNYLVQHEIPIAQMVAADPNAVAMQDDRPVNEYVLLRKLKGSRFQAGSVLAWYEHTKHP
jgi:hypothetical protein